MPFLIIPTLPFFWKNVNTSNNLMYIVDYLTLVVSHFCLLKVVSQWQNFIRTVPELQEIRDTVHGTYSEHSGDVVSRLSRNFYFWDTALYVKWLKNLIYLLARSTCDKAMQLPQICVYIWHFMVPFDVSGMKILFYFNFIKNWMTLPKHGSYVFYISMIYKILVFRLYFNEKCIVS